MRFFSGGKVGWKVAVALPILPAFCRPPEPWTLRLWRTTAASLMYLYLKADDLRVYERVCAHAGLFVGRYDDLCVYERVLLGAMW